MNYHNVKNHGIEPYFQLKRVGIKWKSSIKFWSVSYISHVTKNVEKNYIIIIWKNQFTFFKNDDVQSLSFASRPHFSSGDSLAKKKNKQSSETQMILKKKELN